MAKRSINLPVDNFEDWEYLPEGIQNSFAGYTGFSSSDHEIIFFKALAELPHKVIDFAKEIYFTSTSKASSGETFNLRGDFIKRHSAIVILYPRTWRFSFKMITNIIAHEIAHVYLGHEWGETHSIEKEIEADDLASKWLGRKINYYRKLEKRLNRHPTTPTS